MVKVVRDLILTDAPYILTQLHALVNTFITKSVTKDGQVSFFVPNVSYFLRFLLIFGYDVKLPCPIYLFDEQESYTELNELDKLTDSEESVDGK